MPETARTSDSLLPSTSIPSALAGCARALAPLLVLGLSACSAEGPAEAGSGAVDRTRSLAVVDWLLPTGTAAEQEVVDARPRVPIPQEVYDKVRWMMQELEPLDPNLTSDYHDRHFIRNQKMMEELVEGPRELGLAAMLAYADYGGEDVNVSRQLLRVAAHCAPEDSRELLAHLTLEYGYPISDRTEAALFLAETSPERYLEIVEPFVMRNERLRRTMPNDEFLVRGWAIACEKSGRSPVPELAAVVMNLLMEDAARHFAAEELGKFQDPIGQNVLTSALIESSGNNYLRIKAAQSLARSMPRETACELFREVLEREASINFAKFLRSMLDYHCGS